MTDLSVCNAHTISSNNQIVLLANITATLTPEAAAALGSAPGPRGRWCSWVSKDGQTLLNLHGKDGAVGDFSWLEAVDLSAGLVRQCSMKGSVKESDSKADHHPDTKTNANSAGATTPALVSICEASSYSWSPWVLDYSHKYDESMDEMNKTHAQTINLG